MQNYYPKITVITPAFNQGEFIETTIKSVIEQDYPFLEYIIIDGGSTDNTVNSIRKYEDRISWWITEKDKGQTDAINKGIEKASGEIITWLNSDDYFLPGTLLRVAKFWNEKKFDLLVGNCVFVDVNGVEISREPKSKLINDDTYLPFHKDCIINQPSSFFSRNAINKTGKPDIRLHYSMDVDFWMKMAARNMKFRYVDVYFTCFRRHNEAKSSGGNIPFIEETLNSDYYRTTLASDSRPYYRKVRSLLITEYYRNLVMEHKTRDLWRAFLRFVWIKPGLSCRVILNYTLLKLKLFLKNKTGKN